MSKNPSTHWKTPQLLTTLAAYGWGPLTGREYQGCRSVLRGLADRLPYGSGQGHVTAEQISCAAGLSERWTRRCMYILEDLGIIRWVRGGVIGGQPQPSFIRIIKRSLVALINAARPQRTKAQQAHRVKTIKRLARAARYIPRRNRSGHSHAELDTDPYPLQGEVIPSLARKKNLTQPKGKAMRPMPMPPEHRIPKVCIEHGEPRGGAACPLCRANALTPEQIAEWQELDQQHSTLVPAIPACQPLTTKGLEIAQKAKERLRAKGLI